MGSIAFLKVPLGKVTQNCQEANDSNISLRIHYWESVAKYDSYSSDHQNDWALND